MAYLVFQSLEGEDKLVVSLLIGFAILFLVVCGMVAYFSDLFKNKNN